MTYNFKIYDCNGVCLKRGTTKAHDADTATRLIEQECDLLKELVRDKQARGCWSYEAVTDRGNLTIEIT